MNLKIAYSILLLLLVTGFCDAKGKKNLYVADRKVVCAGNFECIQIREKAKAPWRVYADTIEGFNYEEGYEYKISVEQLQTKNTLSGLYEEKYKLLKVISKKKTTYDPAKKLEEKKWMLISMNDTKRTLTTKDTFLVIQFSFKDGRIWGKNVCNGFTGSFTAKGANISLTNISSTKMLCKNKMEFEDVIFQFYKNTTTYKITGNRLTLYQPDGSYMVFEGK